MNYTAQILFALGAIGTLNSLLVALYFLIHPRLSDKSNRLFGGFLLILSARVLKSIFYAFSTEEPVWFLQSGPAFFGLIGPFVFTYTLSIVKPNSFWVKYGKYHLLFWFLTLILIAIFIPFKTNIGFNKEVLLPILNFQWLGFILSSGLVLRFEIWKQGRSIQFNWLAFMLTTNLILWVSFTFIRFDYFISGSIIFSFLFYSIFLYFLLNGKVTNSVFKRNSGKEPSFTNQEKDQLIAKLEAYFENQKPYKNPNLKIADISEKLGISSHELSRFTNQVIGKSITGFINEYRVEEARQLLGKESNYTIEAIGEQSGFNSKSAFYKAFKSQTGTTPAKYKARL
ncbi:helix-turn-helix domain-containing protein [Maribacter aurantiacus]|uniref:AraC family transcriptional regulator n=1 Tax=Maribacter aurantiacus TaxID=1882343 RepID=A0A5R8M6V6_9FLAO|nr:helix-turn-helix domain-containing protein [Maribacter aurantiacus]TLF45283.1 AraC family transcriptional regulator [Maribacter aurantiacus]